MGGSDEYLCVFQGIFLESFHYLLVTFSSVQLVWGQIFNIMGVNSINKASFSYLRLFNQPCNVSTCGIPALAAGLWKQTGIEELTRSYFSSSPP